MNSPKELTLPKGSKVKIDGIPYWLKQATVVTGFSEPTMPVSGKNNDTSASVYETSKTLATIAALWVDCGIVGRIWTNDN